MTINTPNLALTLYNSSTDQAEFFSNFRATIAGVAPTSNFYKIDTAYGVQAGQITSLQATRGAIYVPALYVSANYYEANSITEITTYTTNMTIILSLDTASAGTVTLNINSLGTKSLYKINSAGTGVNIAAGELMVGKNYLFRYNGSEWIWVSPNSIDQIYGSGTSGNVVTLNTDNTLVASTTQAALIVGTTNAATAETSPTTDDLFPIVNDPAGTPGLKKITLPNALKIVNGLTADVTPDFATDYLLSYDASASAVKKVLIGDVMPSVCGTRLSLVTGDPNPIADQTAKTSLFCMPYGINNYPRWNGLYFVAQTFAETTLTMNAAHTAGSVYDVYMWMDGTTQRLVTSPAWATAVTRGTGAGTAEIETLYGVDVNKVEMTVRNGANTYTMPVRYGTMVGTICPSADGQLEWGTSVISVSNRYNQRQKSANAIDTTDSWNYTTATWRAVNNNTTNGVGRVAIVHCIPQAVHAHHTAFAFNADSEVVATGVGVDSTSVNSAQVHGGYATPAGTQVIAHYYGMIEIGSHYVQKLEYSTANGTTTWIGDGGQPTFRKSGMVVMIWA